MSEYCIVDISKIAPPANPMRQDTLYEGLEELKESMAEKGLQQPIGVRRIAMDEYEVIWGMRRTLAARELGWLTIPAMVYEKNEGDPETLMAHENFHRSQLNAGEEAEFYRRLRDNHNISISEVARRCRRSASHVASLLGLLEGDPEVMDALRKGDINQAQARVLNTIKDELGRSQGLAYARNGGLTARYLENWARSREMNQVDIGTANVAEALRNQPMVDYKTMAKCQVHNDWVPMVDCPPRMVCDKCWTLIVEVMSEWADNHTVEEANRPR